MDLGLEGRQYLVVGASRGLGQAVAEALESEGASVYKTSREPASDEFWPLNTARLDSVEQFVARWGQRPLDGIFVNTGGPPAKPWQTLTLEEWQTAFQQLVLGPMWLVKELLGQMNRDASILFNTSSSVTTPIPGLMLSNVLRPAIHGLAKTLADELGPAGIRVNVIVPGRIDTERVRTLDQLQAERLQRTLPEVRHASEAQIPLGRYGLPEEFGRAAAWLLSPAASYIHGAAIRIDGGLIRAL